MAEVKFELIQRWRPQTAFVTVKQYFALSFGTSLLAVGTTGR